VAADCSISLHVSDCGHQSLGNWKRERVKRVRFRIVRRAVRLRKVWRARFPGFRGPAAVLRLADLRVPLVSCGRSRAERRRSAGRPAICRRARASRPRGRVTAKKVEKTGLGAQDQAHPGPKLAARAARAPVARKEPRNDVPQATPEVGDEQPSSRPGHRPRRPATAASPDASGGPAPRAPATVTNSIQAQIEPATASPPFVLRPKQG